MISLTASARDAIMREGEAAYPNECCGFLFGRDDGGKRAATRVLPVRNARESAAARRRFEITPKDFLRAEREAMKGGSGIVGVYHSHPDHPATPSNHDLEHALPYYSYVIVSVSEGKSGRLTSWRLENDRSRFDEEEVTTDAAREEQTAPSRGPGNETTAAVHAHGD
jgi:proteasome lid subunit RPN8/RPN11